MANPNLIQNTQRFGKDVYSSTGEYISDPTTVDWNTNKVVSEKPMNLASGASAFGPSPTAALQTYADKEAEQRNALIASQNQRQDQLFGTYKNTLSGQESLMSAYDRMNTEGGIPELRKELQGYTSEIYKTKDLLNALEGNVNERTKGFNVTEAQRQRVLAYERNPLVTELSRLGDASSPIREQLSSAQTDLATKLGLISQDQAKALKPIELEINTLSDRFAREMTGFDKNKETELTSLMDKLNRDRVLQDREWQQLADLAKDERDFQQQKELAAIQARASNPGTANLQQQLLDILSGKNTAGGTVSNVSSGINPNSAAGIEMLRRSGEYPQASSSLDNFDTSILNRQPVSLSYTPGVLSTASKGYLNR